MLRRLFIAVGCSLVLPLACATPTERPAAPPAVGASLAPRFDGVYASRVGKVGDEGLDVLRFFADGRVLALSTTSSSSLEAVVRLLLAASERCATGTYALEDGVLRFALHSARGTVDYAGSIRDDQLTASWKSGINGVTADETFGFVHVVEQTADDPAPPAEPPEAPATTPVTPELTLIPEGAAWFCFRAPGASRCERKLAACEAARKTAATVRKDAKIGRCAKQATSFCFTVVQRSGGGHGAASCSATEADCKAESASLKAEGDDSGFTLSTCQRQ